MAFLSFLLGKKPKTERYSPYSTQQQNYLNRSLSTASQAQPQAAELLQMLLGQAAGGGQSFGEGAQQRFEQDILPTLAQRFTSQFGEGAGASSGFASALGEAGQDFATQLEQQDFMNRMAQAQLGLGYLQGVGSEGLTRQFYERQTPGKRGALGIGLEALANAAAGGLMGGPAGAIAGGISSFASGWKNRSQPQSNMLANAAQLGSFAGFGG